MWLEPAPLIAHLPSHSPHHGDFCTFAQGAKDRPHFSTERPRPRPPDGQGRDGHRGRRAPLSLLPCAAPAPKPAGRRRLRCFQAVCRSALLSARRFPCSRCRRACSGRTLPGKPSMRSFMAPQSVTTSPSKPHSRRRIPVSSRFVVTAMDAVELGVPGGLVGAILGGFAKNRKDKKPISYSPLAGLRRNRRDRSHYQTGENRFASVRRLSGAAPPFCGRASRRHRPVFSVY